MTQESPPMIDDGFDADFPEEMPESVDRAAIKRMQVVATILDDSIRIPGTNYHIGLDPIIGTIPVAGDVVSTGISMYIVLESARLGVTYTTLVAMLANVSIDFLGGSIPYIGDVFDAVWKANERNLELVLQDLTEQGQTLDDDSGTRIDVEQA